MAAEFAHLPQDVRPVAALDAEARIAHIRTERWVQHAAADRVLAYLHEALDQPPRDRMENILLVGESGMGKRCSSGSSSDRPRFHSMMAVASSAGPWW